jgi:hypothetical protein
VQRFLEAISFSATALAMPTLIGENAWAELLLKNEDIKIGYSSEYATATHGMFIKP